MEQYSEGKIHVSEPESGKGNVNTVYFVNQADHVYFVHPSTDISVNISTDARPMYQLTYRPSAYQYVDRHIGRHLADMSTDKSVDCRSIWLPICRSRGAQNTHDPIRPGEILESIARPSVVYDE